jgi:prepilin-type N-terminal cleavage/methylation domain-containing protein
MSQRVLRRTPQGLQRGMALLEVIVAMTILVIAALSTVAWVGQASDAVVRAGTAAAETDSASDYLDRIALWTRDDLDRHLGPRRQGAWTVTVERMTPALYVVTMRDGGNYHTLLRTVLYRPEVPDVTS